MGVLFFKGLGCGNVKNGRLQGVRFLHPLKSIQGRREPTQHIVRAREPRPYRTKSDLQFPLFSVEGLDGEVAGLRVALRVSDSWVLSRS
jgi:hypothetical protein